MIALLDVAPMGGIGFGELAIISAICCTLGCGGIGAIAAIVLLTRKKPGDPSSS